MSHTKLVVLLAAVLVAGLAGGYWIAYHRMSDHAASAQSTPGASAAERRILYWHDPMVPNTRFDKPGKSPFMDMQLVPVYADDAAGGATVRVSANVSQNLGIRLGKVEKRVMRARVTAVGNLAFDEDSVQVVQARVEGYLTRLYVKAPMSQVRKGEPLADIVAPAWLAAQEEYLALLAAQSERGKSIRDAARQRLLVLGVPEPLVRDIEAQRKTWSTTTLLAPRDGVVTELAVREGSSFMPGAPLFRINGLDTVWAIAQIPEAQVSLISPGSAVTARAIAWPGESFKGRLVALLPEVDAQSRTLAARVAIQNPGRRLAPGMSVSLEFSAPTSEAQLVIPSEAVIATGERNVVVVARQAGGFDVVDVETGAEADGSTAILSGLVEGQSIVLSGQFLVDSEASLRSTVSRLGTGAESSAQDVEPAPGPRP